MAFRAAFFCLAYVALLGVSLVAHTVAAARDQPPPTWFSARRLALVSGAMALLAVEFAVYVLCTQPLIN